MPADSEVRLAFSRADGCLDVTDAAQSTLAASVPIADRVFRDPSAVDLGQGKYLLMWRSEAKDGSIDDRLQARLVSKLSPYFLPSALDVIGQPDELDVSDRWMIRARLI